TYAQHVLLQPFTDSIGTVAATDVAYDKQDDRAYAAIVIYDPQTQTVIEQASWSGTPEYPYQSGLFSLREAPLLFAAWASLSSQPDLLLVDGHGIAHPRRFGLASHLGVALDLPTIGVSKTPFFGEHTPPPPQRGAYTPILDQATSIGCTICTQDNTKPMYVSPGHKMDIDSAISIVLQLSPRSRQPEPLRAAHLYSVQLRSAGNA
ncbi:MAG: endonuclease V, partial [Myxococcota bacterium]